MFLKTLLCLYLFLPPLPLCTPTLPIHTAPIQGNISMGYYFLDIYVGTPPQKSSLILDTASGVTALPCEPCTQCGSTHLNPRFKVNQSSTSKLLTCDSGLAQCQDCSKGTPDRQCEFRNNYAEGSSIRGYYIEDVMALAKEKMDSEGVRVVFGCINNETSMFVTQEADGILGLSPMRESNLLEKIYQEHHSLTEEKLIFGICLAINGGTFSLGNINPTLHPSTQPPITIKLHPGKYSSLHSNLNSLFNLTQSKFYSLSLQQFYVGNRSLHMSPSDFQGDGMFLDSGATYSFLPFKYHTVVVEELDSVCRSLNCTIAKGESVRCYHLGEAVSMEEQVERFPGIEISVPGTDRRLKWSPWSYFMMRNQKEREICLGIERLGRMILGSNWMADRDIYFDLNKAEIHVYQNSNCTYKTSSETSPVTQIPSAPPTTQHPKKQLRMMYKTMRPRLSQQDQPDTVFAYIGWTWLLFIIIVLVLAVIIALVTICITRAEEKDQEEKKVTEQVVEEEFQDGDENNSCHEQEHSELSTSTIKDSL